MLLCDKEQLVTLHRVNDSYHLWQHLETYMHKHNIVHDKKIQYYFLESQQI